jgi:hypothetical protein
MLSDVAGAANSSVSRLRQEKWSNAGNRRFRAVGSWSWVSDQYLAPEDGHVEFALNGLAQMACKGGQPLILVSSSSRASMIESGRVSGQDGDARWTLTPT